MKLREYQNNIAIQAANKLTAFGCCYLSMECRTWKTLTALYAADKFNAKSVLFITKLKAIPSVKNDYIALQPSFKLEVVNFPRLWLLSTDGILVFHPTLRLYQYIIDFLLI